MQTEIQVFNFEDTDPIRTVQLDGEVWFVAQDVTLILGLGNPRSSLALLDEDERGVHTMDTLGGMQLVAIINESGLYSLILRSRKPEARKFKKWVTSKVLPEIRKKGYYGEAPALPQSLSEALRAYADTLDQNQKLEQENAILIPKAQAFDDFIDSKGYESVGAVAKSLGTGRDRLFMFMREQGLIMQGLTEPYQQYVEQGLFVIKFSTRRDSIGGQVVTKTTKVTPKGIEYLRRLIAKNAQPKKQLEQPRSAERLFA